MHGDAYPARGRRRLVALSRRGKPPFFQVSGAPQPFSPASSAKHSRLRGATAVNSVCPYCAVGCSQLVYVKNGECIDIEGDPRSPINAGTLCPKGANTFQLNRNPHRPATVLHRRKGVVEVWVMDGPKLSFRVAPEAADALQAHVDQAAQPQ